MSGRQAAQAGASPPAWVLRAVAGGAAAVVLAAVAGVVWLAAPAWRLFGAVGAASAAAPSHLYARALVLRRGEAVDPRRVRQELDAAAYREEDLAAAPEAGEFRPVPGGVLVHLRRFPGPHGADGGGLLDVRFAAASSPASSATARPWTRPRSSRCSWRPTPGTRASTAGRSPRAGSRSRSSTPCWPRRTTGSSRTPASRWGRSPAPPGPTCGRAPWCRAAAP